jgi:hypothetical protein
MVCEVVGKRGLVYFLIIMAGIAEKAFSIAMFPLRH